MTRFLMLLLCFVCGSLSAQTPLIDYVGGETYEGRFEGGLYPGASMAAPPYFDSIARAAAASIVPRNQAGLAFPAWDRGKVVFLSIGYSHVTKVWCSPSTTASWLPCEPQTFTGQANADSSIEHARVSIQNGAMIGQAINAWDSASDPDYNIVKNRLTSVSLSEKQVGAVWMKLAHTNPTVALPATNADAFLLVRDGGKAIRAIHTRYPNAKIVFLTSRMYGGWSQRPLNPEPYAYESGFAVKWLIEAQIKQLTTGVIDPTAGDLSLTKAPVLVWAAYFWANGDSARSDGITWPLSDFEADSTHPDSAGQAKAAGLLLDFFKSSPYSKCWLLAARPSC